MSYGAKMKVGDKVWFLFDARQDNERSCVLSVSNIDFRCEEIIYTDESNNTLRVTNVDDVIYNDQVCATKVPLLTDIMERCLPVLKEPLIAGNDNLMWLNESILGKT